MLTQVIEKNPVRSKIDMVRLIDTIQDIHNQFVHIIRCVFLIQQFAGTGNIMRKNIIFLSCCKDYLEYFFYIRNQWMQQLV